MYIMYNRFIHIFIHSSMVKRSSSKRAYKKRGTVRKSRVIRRRKTTQSKRKTYGGGKFGDKSNELFVRGRGVLSGAFGTMKDKLGFGQSGIDESSASPASPAMPPGPSPQDSAAKERADAATAAAATKRTAADAAASVVNERQDDLKRKIAEIKRMNDAFTGKGVGWTPDPNSPEVKAFKELQTSKNIINGKLTAAKTAAAAAEAEAVAAEAEAEAAAAAA